MKKFLFFVAIVLLAATCIKAEPTNAERTTVEKGVLPKVYSKCYDGYLNVRTQPTSKSRIVGRLSNGPEGAQLLGVEGKWSKVRVNGVVGYVWSADLQSTPTEPVFISADDVVGDWHSEHFIGGNWYDMIKISSNGKFVRAYWFGADANDSSNGTWYLSRNKLVLKYSDGEVTTCTVNSKFLEINGTKYLSDDEVKEVMKDLYDI